MAMQCSECEGSFQPTKEQKFPCSVCDECRRPYCNDCSGLSSSEVRCMPLRTRLLKFVCKRCRNYELIDYLRKTVDDKDEIIKSKNEIIELLQEKIRQYEEKKVDVPQVSYADKVKTYKTVNERRTNPPKVVIKPKIVQDGSKTKLDLNKNIDLINLKIGVKQVKLGKGGSVILSCQTKEETEALERAVQEGLKDTYEVALTKMRRPRIKICNFTDQMTPEQIDRCIAEQNGITGDVRTTYIGKTKKGVRTVYCECSPAAFGQIMEKQRLCIGWERFPVYEDLDVPRCFKCLGFYHKKENCRNTIVCCVCSGEHEERLCPKERICCGNCRASNEKFKTGYSCGHSALDPNCPSLQHHKTVLQNRTAYSD